MAANAIEVGTVDVVRADEFQRSSERYIVRYFEARPEVVGRKCSRVATSQHASVGVVAKTRRSYERRSAAAGKLRRTVLNVLNESRATGVEQDQVTEELVFPLVALSFVKEERALAPDDRVVVNKRCLLARKRLRELGSKGYVHAMRDGSAVLAAGAQVGHEPVEGDFSALRSRI